MDEFGCCVGTCTLGLARSRRKSVLTTEGAAWLVRVAGEQLPWSSLDGFEVDPWWWEWRQAGKLGFLTAFVPFSLSDPIDSSSRRQLQQVGVSCARDIGLGLSRRSEPSDYFLKLPGRIGGGLVDVERASMRPT